jgi:hypothetical protein
MTYSHRNGETKPPTIHEEYYWFEADENSRVLARTGCYYIYSFYSVDDPARLAGDDGAHIDKLKGRWWGPVTPPWDNDV